VERDRKLKDGDMNPLHPGGFAPRQCLEPFGLTIMDVAAPPGVTRTTLSELVNEKRGVSPEMR
jgi:addiction module HigA family antidote